MYIVQVHAGRVREHFYVMVFSLILFPFLFLFMFIFMFNFMFMFTVMFKFKSQYYKTNQKLTEKNLFRLDIPNQNKITMF